MKGKYSGLQIKSTDSLLAGIFIMRKGCVSLNKMNKMLFYNLNVL